MRNVGDKVKVRKDLEVGKTYGNDAFVVGMKQYLGKEMTIESYWSLGNGYTLQGNSWHWTEEMLEPLSINRVEIRDNVRIIINQPVVVYIINDGDKQYKGIAKAMKGDIWNESKGIEIARTKAEIKQLTAKLKQLSK